MEPKQAFYAYELVTEPESANYCLVCGGRLTDYQDTDRTRRVCRACGFVRYRNAAPGVAILIVDGDRFVLCRRTPRAFQGEKWCLPCGYIEYEEDFLTAARREVQEETGLNVEIVSILSVASNFLAPNIHTVVTVLLARPLSGELLPGDDIDLVKWIARDETLPEMAFESDRHIIERYFATRFAGAPVDVARAGSR